MSIEIPSIVQRQFYLPQLEDMYVVNDYYVALSKYIEENFPYLINYNLANDKELTRAIIKRFMEYLDTEFDLKSDNLYLRHYYGGRQNFTITIGNEYKYFEIDLDEFEKMFSGVDISFEFIQNKDGKLDLNVKTVTDSIFNATIGDIKNNKVIVKMKRGKEAIVVNEVPLPLLKLPFIIHEVAHAITLTQLWHPQINLQLVSKMSTFEFLAEALTYMFFRDELGWIQDMTPFLHFEYLLYHRDFLKNPKDFRNFTKNIIENGYITNFEAIGRYYRHSFGVMFTLNSIIKDMTTLTPTSKYVPLSSVIRHDYALIFFILNFEIGEPLILTKLPGITSETKEIIYEDRKMSIEDFIKKIRYEMILYLFDYDSENNMIRSKRPLECLHYKGIHNALLVDEICREG